MKQIRDVLQSTTLRIAPIILSCFIVTSAIKAVPLHVHEPLQEQLQTHEKTITLGIHEETDPNILSFVQRAFDIALINVIFKKMPAERSLIESAQGRLDGELQRIPQAVRSYPTLIPINVPVSNQGYWVWVNKDVQCPSSEVKLRQLKPIGVLGIRYFEYIYQNSLAGFIEAPSIASAAEMLARRRGDYTVAPDFLGQMYASQERFAFKTCFDKPFLTVTTYTYLHEKNIDIIETLESAYRQARNEKTNQLKAVPK